jgi:hypothetical protein
MVPYFTTNNGNSTLMSIVNTDVTNGKAVKVRFRSAANSDDIFDFQVYMSPGDVWTAAVSQGADGRSMLTTNDKSCTLPFSVNQSFITDRLPATADDATKAAWTREGYVEIFNMADIADTSSTTDLFTRVKHVAGVAPCLAGASTDLLTQLSTNPATPAAAETGSAVYAHCRHPKDLAKRRYDLLLFRAWHRGRWEELAGDGRLDAGALLMPVLVLVLLLSLILLLPMLLTPTPMRLLLLLQLKFLLHLMLLWRCCCC